MWGHLGLNQGPTAYERPNPTRPKRQPRPRLLIGTNRAHIRIVAHFS